MYLLIAVVLSIGLNGETATQSTLKMLFPDQKHCEDTAAILIKTNKGFDKPGQSHKTIAFCKKEQ